MTITQTLDKHEEHLAGIIPAFMMLGVVVFILLVLGAAVAPASAIIVDDLTILTPEYGRTSNFNNMIADSDIALNGFTVYLNGVVITPTDTIRSGFGYVKFVYATTIADDYYYQDFGDYHYFDYVQYVYLPEYLSALSSANPGITFFSKLIGGNVQVRSYEILAYDFGDDSGNTDTGGDNGDDSGNTDTGGDDNIEIDWTSEELMDDFEFTSPIYGKGGFYNSDGIVWSDDSWASGTSSESRTVFGENYDSSVSSGVSYYYNGEEIPLELISSWRCSSWLSAIRWTWGDVPDGYIEQYLCKLSKDNPDYVVIYHPLSRGPQISARYVGDHSVSNAYINFDVDYSEETDDYSVSIERNGEPWYLSIKGKAFGWIPVYTYTSVTLEDIEFDTYLSGLPSRFLMFDIDYVAEVYKAGSGTTDSTDKFYYYSWTRSEFVDEEGNLLDPDVIGTEGEKTDFDSLVDPPEFVEDKGYDVPPIGDLDEDGIHNKDDDDLDGDGIPNEEDDEPYNPYNNGILGSLGFTPNVSLPDIESITDMMRNMKLPASLKEIFNIPLPDEYKAGIAVEEGHVLYGYQQLWFGLGDGVIGLFMGIILVIAALIACIPRFLFEFFSSLIEWLNVAFQSFYDWLVIPSEIFKLVIGLLPDELLAIALLLFGIDLVFLFFRFVIPGLISGSRAVGDIAQKEEEIRSYEDENHGKRRYK